MLTIFNDNICEYIDENKEMIDGFLYDNQLNKSDDNIYNAAVLIDDDYNEFMNLIKSYDKNICYDSILICGSLGLWYGRRQIKPQKFNSLYDAIVTATCDNNKFYAINKNASLSLAACHHDGVNKFKFYKVISGKKYAIKYNELIKLF